LTKVQIYYQLDRPLDDDLLTRIGNAHSIYGIEKIQVSPTLDSLMVEFDATRFSASNVTAALRSRGLPITPVAGATNAL
jgi:hypothetical protein